MQKKWVGKGGQLGAQRARGRRSALTVSCLFLVVICAGAAVGRLAAQKFKSALSSTPTLRMTTFRRKTAGNSQLGTPDTWGSADASFPAGAPITASGAAELGLGSQEAAVFELTQKQSGAGESGAGGAEAGAVSDGVFLHHLDDEALFRRVVDLESNHLARFQNRLRVGGSEPGAGEARQAYHSSFESSQPGQASPSTKKLALMFLTLGTLPLAPFWSRFLSGHEGKFSLYIHSAGNASRYSMDQLPLVFHGRRVPGAAFGWGSMTVVQAERRLLASALLDPANERFVLLSDSCIPLFNFSFTYDFIMGTPFSFVKGLHVLTADLGVGHWNADFLPLITIREWVSGSTWFVIDRELASAVVRDFSFYTTFVRACDFSKGCYPEDHYVQTLVHMHFTTKLMNRTLTWDNWSGGGNTPSWFAEADVLPKDVGQSLVLRLGKDSKTKCPWNDGLASRCYLFARQFMPSSLDALLALSPRLGFSSQGRGKSVMEGKEL